ncbi:MAG: cbb3-type cytochrome c oxidase subunit I [Gammaproteobacteria bacterium]|nr:cbb3-type cytochrome c oxidase subunit I [Gammaproteobacteria bacterium]MBI5615282.1 cbb3-type cytochrome c oxidase subunit I [Gammaproteobacteria bacterium]
MPTRYVLPVPAGAPRRLAAAWLALGISALIASGLLALLLVLSRTPALQDLVPWVASFKTALVIHVDLSVLIWFLAFAGAIWSLASSERFAIWGWLAFVAAALGTAVMALSPFTSREPMPLLNNYIPVLQQPVFLAGLALVGVGFALVILRTLVVGVPRALPEGDARALACGTYGAAVIAALSLGGFVWSWLVLPGERAGQAYYELLFWGPGHVLQFTHGLLVCVVWLWLAGAGGARRVATARLVGTAFVFAALPVVLAGPLLYALATPGTGPFQLGMTTLMRFGHLAMLPVAACAVAALFGVRGADTPQRSVHAALLWSIGLFAVGGILGFLIQGVNVVIPAHYHGAIVGVTLAYMGLTYHLLPRLGFAAPSERFAYWQPFLYGGGQFLHVLGLAWSGAHGVQRKVAGAAQALHTPAEIFGMALTGLGGTLAVAGGVLFLVLTVHAIAKRPR